MPTYLLHGFRWPRPLVRIHIIMQNLDDAAPEWLVAPNTTLALLKNFHELYPECMQHLGRLRFVEQYDANDALATSGPSQPFAYVADLVEEVKLGVEIEDIRGRGLEKDQWSAITDLRDKIAPEEKVGWYIVVCGDEERAARPSSDGGQESAIGSSVATAPRQIDARSQSKNRNASATSLAQAPSAASEQPEAKVSGLKKFLTLRLGRRKSRAQLNDSKRTRSKSSHSVHREGADSSNERPPPLPTGVVVHSDGSSSTPSIHASATASTPPLPDDIFELPAITPSSSRSTPPPSEFNFIPELEPKLGTNRMSESPDFTETVLPEVEPKCANMPPIDPQKRVSARRSSDVPPFSQRGALDHRNSVRRHSDLPSLLERSPRTSDVSGVRNRSESPEFRQGRRVMSFPNVRSGAVSPLTFRSISPSGRSGAVSPIARSSSPIRSGAISPLTQDEQSFAKIQRRTTFQLRQQRRQQMATLNTQTADPAHQRSSSQDTDDDEEMDEVIMMSPAMRAPPKHFLRRSGTGGSFMSQANRSTPATALDSIVESDGRPYFGQEVDPNDLVAVNLENAFDNL